MALPSATSPTVVPVACALTWSMSWGCRPASWMARVIACPACSPLGSGATMWNPSEVMLAPISRARMVAPRALACSSVSITISAPPSPNTKPLRSLSNGRQAPAGSSLVVDNTMRIWAKPAIGTASILVSTPPQIATSASPSTICRHACAMPSEPEAQAEIGVLTPALALRSSPTAAAAAFGMYICTASGDTARRPLPRKRLVGVQQFLARAHAGADRHHQSLRGRPRVNRRAPTPAGSSTVDICCRYDSRRSSTRVSSLSKSSRRWPPMRTGRSYCSTNGSSSSTDAALPVQQPLPGGLRVGRQGGRHRESGDDHVGETVPRGKPGQRCHYCSESSFS